MVQLQEALLSEVFKYGDFKVGNKDRGINLIKTKLYCKKVLIVVNVNKLWMHELLQEMAKELVRCEYPKEPGKRSRLWFHEDVLHVLNQNMVYSFP